MSDNFFEPTEGSTESMPPNCGCICHSVPGVMHVAACCYAPPASYDSPKSCPANGECK